MSIVDWYIHDLSTEERTPTLDLLFVAIADQEFCEEEKDAIPKACEFEKISLIELIRKV